MTIFLYVLGVLLFLVGFVGLALPMIPGSPVMFLGAVVLAWAGDFERIGLPGLILLGLVALVTLLVDWFAEVLGARGFGASYWGMAGAILGLLAGLPFGLPGIVLGPIVGSVVLELIQDSDVRRAGRAGLGALVGFLLGTAIKYALGLMMAGLLVVFLIF